MPRPGKSGWVHSLRQDAMNRLRIALADDRPIFRKSLCMSLERESGLLVVGEAGDGLVATEMVEDTNTKHSPG